MMAERKLGPMDVAMNFLNFRVAVDAADSTVLKSLEVPTGTSPRSGIALLIHRVDYTYGHQPETTGQLNIALSTRAGEAAMPTLDDDGLLDLLVLRSVLQTNGMVAFAYPVIHSFWPPIALASPKIVCYVSHVPDAAAEYSKNVNVRVGFTTAVLDAEMYREISETWGW